MKWTLEREAGSFDRAGWWKGLSVEQKTEMKQICLENDASFKYYLNHYKYSQRSGMNGCPPLGCYSVPNLLKNIFGKKQEPFVCALYASMSCVCSTVGLPNGAAALPSRYYRDDFCATVCLCPTL